MRKQKFNEMKCSAKSCTHREISRCIGTGWESTSWKAALQNRPCRSGGHQTDLDPELHPHSKEAQRHPELHLEEPHQHLVSVYQFLVGENKEDEPRVFLVLSTGRTRCNGAQIETGNSI